ncbi:hypothetical protein J6G99_04100 [bacterium]|nr:hypothetical protein [bacterium]
MSIPAISTILTKGTGLTALGLCLYDAHYLGKVQSDLYASERDAKATGYYLHNSMHLSELSKVQEKVKDFAYDVELDQKWRRFFNEGIGYCKGFGSMVINHVIPITLGLGALLTKGLPSKISAGILAVYGGTHFIKNFFGIGTHPGLEK